VWNSAWRVLSCESGRTNVRSANYQLPVHSGFCLLTKASTPIRKSSLP
jgi:hypothetical protein